MCKYCDFQKWDYSGSNAIDIMDENGEGFIYIGRANVDDADNKRVRIFTYDDDGMIWFFPKYCPFCGRKLKD